MDGIGGGGPTRRRQLGTIACVPQRQASIFSRACVCGAAPGVRGGRPRPERAGVFYDPLLGGFSRLGRMRHTSFRSSLTLRAV
jgi:hypothetical protein